MQETRVGSLSAKIPWSRKWLPTPVLLPGNFHGHRSLEGCSPWGHKESDTTERRHAHTHTYTHTHTPIFLRGFCYLPVHKRSWQFNFVARWVGHDAVRDSDAAQVLLERGRLGTPLATSVWKRHCLWVVFGDLCFIRRWQLTSGLAGCKSIAAFSLQPRIITAWVLARDIIWGSPSLNTY